MRQIEMRAGLAASAIALSAALMSANAVASEKEACFASAVAGQRLRMAGRLIDAQRELIACSRPVCPVEVTRDCTTWLGEVNAALPTVVFRARDGAVDLLDAKAFVDGKLAEMTSDGRAVPIDPGTHKIRFTREGRPDVELTVVIGAGDKNRPLTAQFASPPSPPPPPPQPPPDRSTSGGAAPVPVATWALGGVGVVALGLFGYFGAVGVSDFNGRGCSVGCSASDKSTVQTELRAADIALAVGVVAFGAATILYFTRPSARVDALRAATGTVRF